MSLALPVRIASLLSLALPLCLPSVWLFPLPLPNVSLFSHCLSVLTSFLSLQLLFCVIFANTIAQLPSCRHICLSRSGELQKQKLKSHLMRTQSLKVLPLKHGVDQYIARHATLTARDFYPSGPFTCIFSKPLPSFPCVSCG